MWQKTKGFLSGAVFTLVIAIPVLVLAQDLLINQYGSPSIVADGGKDLVIATSDEVTPADVIFKVDDVEVGRFDAATGDLQLQGGLYAAEPDLEATATLAAAGADDTDAALITVPLTYVTAADGTKGVELPAGSIGNTYCVINTHATNVLKLYPPALGTLNGGTATTGSISIAGTETVCYKKVSSTAWHGQGTNRRYAGSIVAATTITAGTGLAATTGDVVLSASGSLRYQEATAGTKCMGTVTANGVTAVPVSTTCALTASRIFISRTSVVAAGVTEPGCWATNIVNATSFDLDCNDAAEDSTFNWFIVNESA